MRISELSRASGVSVATIKYYLREGLLPRGTVTLPNQAEYDDLHLRRLRLIRVLIEVGGLGIAAVRRVLDAIADASLSTHQVLGVAHHALGPDHGSDALGPEEAEAMREVDRLIASLRWSVSTEAPARRLLAHALLTLRRSGRHVPVDAFLPYAEAADALAAHELATVPREGPRSEIVEGAVVGTVVFEAALVALRRLAQEHYSARRFARPGGRGARRGSSGNVEPETGRPRPDFGRSRSARSRSEQGEGGPAGAGPPSGRSGGLGV